MDAVANKHFKNTGFHHVALKVKDFDKTLNLYSNVLGLSEVLSWNDKPNRACMLDIGDGTYIELFEGGSSNGTLQKEPIIHFAFTTDECNAMYKASLDAGCKSHMAPENLTIEAKTKNLPVRISFVIGYDGELIEFFQYR